jgi:hypothetical protein
MIKIKKISIAAFILAVLLLCGFYGYEYIKEGKKVGEKTYQRMIQDPEKLAENTSVRDEMDFIVDIHQMANTIIIPEDGKIKGRIPITDEKCNAMLLEVMASSYENKEQYLKILERWKSRDFSHGVYDHNYVWELLGGVIGRAVRVKE